MSPWGTPVSVGVDLTMRNRAYDVSRPKAGIKHERRARLTSGWCNPEREITGNEELETHRLGEADGDGWRQCAGQLVYSVFPDQWGLVRCRVLWHRLTHVLRSVRFDAQRRMEIAVLGGACLERTAMQCQDKRGLLSRGCSRRHQGCCVVMDGCGDPIWRDCRDV
jgi:hypothetical protein